MSASVGEPFLLASYEATVNESAGDHLRASSSTTTADQAIVTLTVAGEGIHIIDLTSLHPIASHTFDPSWTFSAPALSRLETSTSGKPVRAIYIPLRSTQTSGGGSRISKWEQSISDDFETPLEEQFTKSLPKKIDALYTCSSLPENLIVLSPSGEVTVTDLFISVIGTRKPNKSSTLINSFVFDGELCPFLQPGVPPESAIVLSLLRSQGRFILELIAIGDAGNNIASFGRVVLELDNEEVLEFSADSSGTISVLLSSGQWHSFQIHRSSAANVLLAKPLAEILPLRSTIFTSLPSTASYSTSKCVSLLPLGSSLVLMALSPCNSLQTLTFLLWDLQYSVVLASNSTPVPASLGNFGSGMLNVKLLAATFDQCLVIVSSSTQTKGSLNTTRSSVLVLPFSVPSASTVATALGHRKATSEWLEPPAAKTSDPVEQIRNNVLSRIEDAVKLSEQDTVNKAFFDWVKSEESKLESHTSDITFAPTQYGRSKKKIRPTVQARKDAKSAVLSYAFVSQLLNCLLVATSNGETFLHSAILAYLFERRLISQNMMEGGVTNALLKLGDWESIDLALKSMADISESDLVNILYPVLNAERQKLGHAEMDVDGPAAKGDLPSLSQLLSRTLKYPISQAPMRLALHNRFKDVRDIILMMEILDTWLERWISKGPLSGFDTDLTSSSKADTTQTRAKKSEKRTKMPSLDAVLLFTQVLLDTFFVPLVQYRDAQPVLHRIYSRLGPSWLELQNLEFLRGPLDLFVKATQQVMSETPSQNLRSKSAKAPSNSVGVPVKLYQIEEIML